MAVVEGTIPNMQIHSNHKLPGNSIITNHNFIILCMQTIDAMAELVAEQIGQADIQ